MFTLSDALQATVHAYVTSIEIIGVEKLLPVPVDTVTT